MTIQSKTFSCWGYRTISHAKYARRDRSAKYHPNNHTVKKDGHTPTYTQEEGHIHHKRTKFVPKTDGRKVDKTRERGRQSVEDIPLRPVWMVECMTVLWPPKPPWMMIESPATAIAMDVRGLEDRENDKIKKWCLVLSSLVLSLVPSCLVLPCLFDQTKHDSPTPPKHLGEACISRKNSGCVSSPATKKKKFLMHTHSRKKEWRSKRPPWEMIAIVSFLIISITLPWRSILADGWIQIRSHL